MGWCIGLGILLFLAILPIGVGFNYDSNGPAVYALAGPFHIALNLSKSASEKSGKEAPNKKTKATPNDANKASEKRGGSIKDFMPLVRTGLAFLNQFRRKLRVRRLELNVVLGGGDPGDLGIQYGRAWASLGNLWPKLEEIFIIKKRDVEIQCDFEASQTLITACLEVTITVGRLLGLILVYGLRGLKEFMKLQKLQKGGTVK